MAKTATKIVWLINKLRAKKKKKTLIITSLFSNRNITQIIEISNPLSRDKSAMVIIYVILARAQRNKSPNWIEFLWLQRNKNDTTNTYIHTLGTVWANAIKIVVFFFNVPRITDWHFHERKMRDSHLITRAAKQQPVRLYSPGSQWLGCSTAEWLGRAGTLDLGASSGCRLSASPPRYEATPHRPRTRPTSCRSLS